jgi:hypothetical protein
MKWFKYIILCILIDFVTLGIWAAQGQHMTTKSEVQEKSIVKDEFGDDKEVITWKKEFKLGMVDGVLPVLGANALALAFIVFQIIKEKKKTN